MTADVQNESNSMRGHGVLRTNEIGCQRKRRLHSPYLRNSVSGLFKGAQQ